jgi:uncharacterized membrane protein YGL010W
LSKTYLLLIERAPALTDNILLIFVAPFFFVFEVMALLGYKKNEIKEWNKVVAREIDDYRKKNRIR